jgi:hypothetical protein
MCKPQELAHKLWTGLVHRSPVELTVADISATPDLDDHGDVGRPAIAEDGDDFRVVAGRTRDHAACWIGAGREGLQRVELTREALYRQPLFEVARASERPSACAIRVEPAVAAEQDSARTDRYEHSLRGGILASGEMLISARATPLLGGHRR